MIFIIWVSSKVIKDQVLVISYLVYICIVNIKICDEWEHMNIHKYIYIYIHIYSVFFDTTNVLFFQENILKYEWNDNVPHKSLSTWRWQSKKTNQNILILYQRTKNTHNVSGKISPKIRMSLTHQKITKILLSVCSSKNVVNTLLAILLNISMTLTKQKKT